MEINKLDKLVEMAKRGIGNEKKNAISLIKKLCSKHNLIFEEVMNKAELQEFELDYKKKKFEKLTCHVFARYGLINEDNSNVKIFKYRNFINYKTTLPKHIEMLNAFDILSKLYEKEQKLINASFQTAFMNKHRLWNYVSNLDKKIKEPTKEELKEAMIANSIENELKSVEIMRQLK